MQSSLRIGLPHPKLTEQLCVIPYAEFKGAAEEGAPRQTKMGRKNNSPSLAHLVATQLRRVAAGERAGARQDSGGIGP